MANDTSFTTGRTTDSGASRARRPVGVGSDWRGAWATALALGAAAIALSSRAHADYPVASHRYLADPGSLVYKDRIYLYNSNDDDNAVSGGYAMKSIVCVSTTDLKNWTDHGIVFQVPADASWAKDSWAPQPVERNGIIYLYFGDNARGIGVASSKDPTSGFKDARGKVLIDGSTPGASGKDIWLFDPGVLIDEDGQAYVSFGGNDEGNARIIKLGSDLTSVSGSAVPVTAKGFFEASFLFKRGTTYYMAYSTNSANGLRIDYLKSNSPMSGYTYGGIVADQPPENGNNNHASEFVFKGKWYHAYHNRVVAKKAGINAEYKRNIAIEVLNFKDDGSIAQVTYTTDGVPQVGTLDPYARVEAETFNAQSGIETDTCNEGGMAVTQISDGDWVKVRGVDFGTVGAKSFSARVASTANNAAIELRLGSESGTLIGTCQVPSTGGAQSWQTVSCDVTGATGVKDLVLKFKGAFNFNYWQFTPVGGGEGGTGGAGGGGGASGSGGSSASAGGPSNQGGQSAGGVSAAGGATASGGSANQGGNPSQGGNGNQGGSANQGGMSVSQGGASGGAVAASGGASNASGGSSQGGTSSSSGGNVASAGETANPGLQPPDSGCSCALPGSTTAPKRPTVLLGLALLALFSRRRRRRDQR